MSDDLQPRPVIYSDEDFIDYWLGEQPELTEEEKAFKMKQLDECADFVMSSGITPNLDSIY